MALLRQSSEKKEKKKKQTNIRIILKKTTTRRSNFRITISGVNIKKKKKMEKKIMQKKKTGSLEKSSDAEYKKIIFLKGSLIIFQRPGTYKL